MKVLLLTPSHQLGEETGLASVERSGRQLSGWRAYGNKVGEARLLGENYGTAAKASKERLFHSKTLTILMVLL